MQSKTRKSSIQFQTVGNPERRGEKFSFEALILGGSRRPERFTPSDVAAFVRGIDPSFDNLASRFLQEVGIGHRHEKDRTRFSLV